MSIFYLSILYPLTCVYVPSLCSLWCLYLHVFSIYPLDLLHTSSFALFFDSVSYSSGWLQTCYVAQEDGFGVLLCLLPGAHGAGGWAQDCMLGKPSVNWSYIPRPTSGHFQKFWMVGSPRVSRLERTWASTSASNPPSLMILNNVLSEWFPFSERGRKLPQPSGVGPIGPELPPLYKSE